MRLNFALLLIPLLFSCSRDKVKVELDDQIGVVPEIEIIADSLDPYQMTECSNGWLFCQEGREDFAFVNRIFNLQAKNNLIDDVRWITKRPSVCTKNGRIYQLYIPTAQRNELYLHELDETGNQVQSTMISNQTINGQPVALEAFSDSVLLIAVATNSGNGSSYKTILYSFNVYQGILDTLNEVPGWGRLIGFHATNSGFWLGFYWKTHVIHNQGGSILYFASDGTLILDRNFPELEVEAYFNNRVGLIRENNNGEAEVFASGAAQSMSGYNPFVCHLTIDKSGGLNAVHVYPETIGCFANDYYFANDQVYVLMKETYGTNITEHLVFNVFSLSGEPRYSKYIRNTQDYSNFIAIGHVDGFHATLFCADQNKSLLKLKF